MVIKAIGTLCKSAKCVYLREGRTDWVGDPMAIYPLYNMPKMNMANVCSMFDISEGKQNKFHLDVQSFPETFSEADNIEDESPINRLRMLMDVNGDKYEVLDTSFGIRLLNIKYLKPLADLDEVELYERTCEDKDGNKTLHIAAKSGFFVYALIIPSALDPIGSKGLLKDIKTISKLCTEYEKKENITYDEK